MSYKCVVIVREAWDTRDLVGAVLAEDGSPKKGALATRFEPEDLNALEMALQLKDKHQGTVTAVSVGVAGEVDVLRESLYRGVDDVVRVELSEHRELETMATAKLLAAAIRKHGAFDLLLAGVNVVEGENSQCGVSVARLLGIDQVSYVENIERIGDGFVVAKRSVEMGYELVEGRLPVALVVGVPLIKEDPRTPRSAKATLKLKLKKAPIPTSTPAELGVGDGRGPRMLVRSWEAVPERVIESKAVDPTDKNALKEMLSDAMKGA